ncbi:MAG TPA: phosphate-starvation-inducible PsiE family protein [Myxococcales bacterium]|nr:phosphate-starvation-inducible PsiE family protein [Myxococcales bacterium]
MIEGTGPVSETGTRGVVARAFSLVEDVVYVGMGLLLAFSAAALLVAGAWDLWKATVAGAPLEAVVGLLDRTLLVLMLVELLYTVRVSFRQHALLPEPFLLVGLIAATRRILVVTAEFSLKGEADPAKFHNGMVEIGLLTVMVLALVASLLMLKRRDRIESPAVIRES